MRDIDRTDLPPLTTLRAFEATARLQGYSAAARTLNVTPAAVAQQVRKLERETGIALVRREGRGLTTTEAGASLAKVLSDAFAAISQGLDDLKLRQATRGLRVSTTDFFVNVIVLPALGDFWRQHPECQISFSPEGNTAPVDLDRFDVVIRGGPPGMAWKGANALALFETRMIICATPGLIGDGSADLCDLPWIADRGIGGTAFEEAVTRAGCNIEDLSLVDPGSAKFEFDAALMGLGLHFGPEIMVRNHLDDGSIVDVGVELGMTGVYYALTRGVPPRSVQVFLDWLSALCAEL